MAARKKLPDGESPDFSFLGEASDAPNPFSPDEQVSSNAQHVASAEPTATHAAQPVETSTAAVSSTRKGSEHNEQPTATDPVSGKHRAETTGSAAADEAASSKAGTLATRTVIPGKPGATVTPAATGDSVGSLSGAAAKSGAASKSNAASKSVAGKVSKSSATAGAAPAGIEQSQSGMEASSKSLRLQNYIVGYAIALTAFVLFALVTGRLSLLGPGRLESLPDLRPLNSNEFQKIPDDAVLPDGHVLQLGQSRRFGDVVLRATKVVREPLTFEGFLNGRSEPQLTTRPVLKLWLEFESQASDYRFPPFDALLMASRSPAEGTDDSVLANSFLRVTTSPDEQPRRVLNFLHSPNSNFVITGQNAAQLLSPGSTIQTFVACDENITGLATNSDTQYSWRVQFRKGVNTNSGHGVGTLVDVLFTETDIETGGEQSGA